MAEFTKERIIEDLKASKQNASGMFEIGEETICALMSLLTTTPAPVSVPECFTNAVSALESLYRNGKKQNWNERYTKDMAYALGAIRAYRAAMLQSFGNSEQLNSPVIPDGWVMVPVEPTAEMISSGIAAHFERS